MKTSKKMSNSHHHEQMLEEAVASLLEIEVSSQTRSNKEVGKTTFNLYPGLHDDQVRNHYPHVTDREEETTVSSPSQVISKMSSSPTVRSDHSKDLLVSVGVGVCGGYMSGHIVRIGSRIVFASIAALLLAGSTVGALHREALKKKKQQQGHSLDEPNNLEQYEMIAKMGIEAANHHIKRMNIKEKIFEKWEKVREYTKDNYPLTSSFLVGFILAMF